LFVDNADLDNFGVKLHFGNQPTVANRAAAQGANAKGTEMNLREPGVCRVDVAKGELQGATNCYVKRLGDLEGLFEDTVAFQALLATTGAQSLAYEVTDFRSSVDAGDMIVGVTRMVCGKVGREFLFTRGHIHANANRPEVYYGESGRGVMLLESPEGEIRTVEITARTICYVPPYWIHRSVNVGVDDLVMTFLYPADSGQDYAIIEEAGGMKARVVDDGAGGWKLVENTQYRARSIARINRVYARAS
jgi:glucose-6-phosphate isomerase